MVLVLWGGYDHSDIWERNSNQNYKIYLKPKFQIELGLSNMYPKIIFAFL